MTRLMHTGGSHSFYWHLLLENIKNPILKSLELASKYRIFEIGIKTIFKMTNEKHTKIYSIDKKIKNKQTLWQENLADRTTPQQPAQRRVAA